MNNPCGVGSNQRDAAAGIDRGIWLYGNLTIKGRKITLSSPIVRIDPGVRRIITDPPLRTALLLQLSDLIQPLLDRVRSTQEGAVPQQAVNDQTPPSSVANSGFAPRTPSDAVTSRIVSEVLPRSPSSDTGLVNDVLRALGRNSSVAYVDSHIYPSGYSGDVTQCVALVRAIAPSLGATEDWTAGTDVSASDPILEFGDPIATFNKDGDYSSTHAAIFLSYYYDGGSIAGMYILDQNTPDNDGDAQVRLRLFDDKMPSLADDKYRWATAVRRDATTQ